MSSIVPAIYDGSHDDARKLTLERSSTVQRDSSASSRTALQVSQNAIEWFFFSTFVLVH